MRRVLALLVLASCRYHATNAPDVSAQCETHCATLHQRCVENGQANALGLPGVTYDLCRRALETCQRDCRPLTSVPTSNATVEAPRDRVLWAPQTRQLRCAGDGFGLTLAEDAAQTLERGGGDAAFISFAPQSVALVRGGRLPPLLDDWALLHARLTQARDPKLDVRLEARTVDGATVWTAAYDVSGEGRFVVRARETSSCRWLLLERADATRHALPTPSW